MFKLCLFMSFHAMMTSNFAIARASQTWMAKGNHSRPWGSSSDVKKVDWELWPGGGLVTGLKYTARGQGGGDK